MRDELIGLTVLTLLGLSLGLMMGAAI